MAVQIAIPAAWKVSTVLRSRWSKGILNRLSKSTTRTPPPLWCGCRRSARQFVSVEAAKGSPGVAEGGDMAAEPSKLDVSFFGGAMPKEEIGALRFLKDHPEFDGRGVVVAIFDTGVDPGAEGLLITSDGKPKILDVLDGSGAGDVDTTQIAELDAEGCILGVTGRKLKVNPEWKNPTGKWHVGAKSFFDIVDPHVKKNSTATKLKKFKEKQRSAVAKAIEGVIQFDAQNPDIKADEAKKKERLELQSRVDLLQSMMEKFNDLGPVLDCVVWHDGEKWVAALDRSDFFEPDSGEGMLADFEPMTNFRAERQYSTFSAEVACNFVCNIYNDGKLLSLVVTELSHGTHVAGIVAANHPDDPSLNGIAPGAQIISCTVGDHREHILEASQALVRAIIGALENKVHLVNMSYGESVRTPNCGRFANLLRDLVYKHRVMFVTSAGNSGPGLSSIGAPSECDAAIGVGAYVSPSFAAAGHSLRKVPPEGQQYTFTARGPTLDGDLGVTLCASGGAISTVPQWTEEKRHLANGTSMASPNATGGVALLMSALIASGEEIYPNRIRRAMENTCQPVDTGYLASELTMGRGLFQVDKAWEYLLKSKEVDFPDMHFEITVKRTDGGPSGRGIYLKEPQDVAQPLCWNTFVSPKLHEDADIRTEKLAVEEKLSLASTKPWVTCPEALLLTHNGRSFEIGVDPTALPPGVHYAEVHGVDVKSPWRGPLFRVPITVCIPTEVESNSGRDQSSLRLDKMITCPGKEVFHFLSVPLGATWAELSVKTSPYEGSKIFDLEAVQFELGKRTDYCKHNYSMMLSGNSTIYKSFRVLEGKNLQLSLGQYWSSNGEAEVELEIFYHGLEVLEGHRIHLDGASGITEFQVTARLRREYLKPSAKLDKLSIPLSPSSDACVEVFKGPRDLLPESRFLSKITLTYKLSVTEPGKFTPLLPQLDNQMYDAEVDGKIVMVYDENNFLLLTTTVYPEAVDLKKGNHTIKVMIRHEKPEFLEKLKDMPLVVVRKLEKALQLPIYPSRHALVARGTQFKQKHLCIGETKILAVGNPTDDLPKDCVAGTTLCGSITLGQVKLGEGVSPGGVDLTYTPPPKPSYNGSENNEKEEKTVEEKVTEAVRDAKIAVLEGLSPIKDEAAYSTLLKELKRDFPKHIPLVSAALKTLNSLEEDDRKGKLSNIVDAANEVISIIDQTALAVFLARKTPEEGKEAKILSKELKKQESALVDALKAKVTALLDMEKSSDDEIEQAYLELGKWVDIKEESHAVMHARREAKFGRYAEAIKSLDKALEGKDRKKSEDKKILLMKAEYMRNLHWDHWYRHLTSSICAQYPANYQPF